MSQRLGLVKRPIGLLGYPLNRIELAKPHDTSMYITPVENRPPHRRANSLTELLSWHDVDFVRCAYATILGRQADAAGEAYYTDRLRRGYSRMEVLRALRRSPEGRDHDPGIAGLDRALKRAAWRSNRWIGWLLAPFLGGEGSSAAWRRNRILTNQLGRLQVSLEVLAADGRGARLDTGTFAQATADLGHDPRTDAAVLLDDPSVAPTGVSPLSSIVALDADRMFQLHQWDAITKAMFERHWPRQKRRLHSDPSDSDRHLWIVISGDATTTHGSESMRSIRALRDAAVFEVEFASLGPRVSSRTKSFSSLASFAQAMTDESLVFFVGQNDQVDPRLADTLLLEEAWSRDFVLTDQFYKDGARIAPLFFHGIDHVHLGHADYISSRFLVSGKLLRAAVAGGAKQPIDVARFALHSLRDKPGRRLHLQFPFLRNGDLNLKAIREGRRSMMHDMAVQPSRARRAWDHSVSVIISTKDGGYLLDGLVDQLLKNKRVAEVIIVSNNTSGDYTLEALERLSNTERCRVFRYDRPFNFSVQTNHAVKEAKGTFLLIMNDDVSLIGSDWLDKLLSDVDSDRPRIAGPLLLYPNQSIQQGGMYLGHNDRAGHTFRHQRHPHDAPVFELVAPRLVSCLTGACLLIKQSLFKDLNGFDEQLATGLQDVDLCLRALHAGVELVFDPRAIIFHLESISLIPTLSDDSVQRQRDREYARFRDRWGAEVHADRWHNRNFYIEDEALRHVRIAD
jgi:GT2 family glycosyltransferase